MLLTLTFIAKQEALQPDGHCDVSLYCCLWELPITEVDETEATSSAALDLTCISEEQQLDLNVSNPPDLRIPTVHC